MIRGARFTAAGGLGRGPAALVLLVLLAGCAQGTVQEALGVRKRAPDEFQVVRRSPLVLPPDYSLRPPQPGAVGPQQGDPSRDAQAILTGRSDTPLGATPTPAPATAAAPATQSPGELALLERSPVAAQPGIRQEITAENEELISLDRSRFLFILNFQRKAMSERNEPVIDPVAEAQRLRSQGQVGSVVTMRTGSQPLPP
jgi:hypothetical protein